VGLPFPQPAHGEQRLSWRLQAPAVVRVDVYDVSGRRIRSLARGRFPAGTHTISWDGRGEDGRPVPAGVYFLRGRAGVAFTRKVVRIR
jgi:flagellar hook assembly protein FlgD